MARKNSGCLPIVGGGICLVWIAQKLQDPETRTAWLAIGATIAICLSGYILLKRTLRKRYLTNKYNDSELVSRIITGSVWEGQTEDQLLDSLGRPVGVDEEILKTKSKYVWKYGPNGKNRFRLRVMIENGTVVGWKANQ